MDDFQEVGVGVRAASIVAWFLVAAAVVLVVVAVGDRQLASGLVHGALSGACLLTFSIVGAIVASRLPRNPIAWMLVAAPVLALVSTLALAYIGAQNGSLPLRELVAWFAEWAWIAGFGPLFAFLGLLFPDGTLPSRRWRPVAWVAGAGVASAVLGQAFGTWINFGGIHNPVGVSGASYLTFGGFGMLVGAIGGLTAMVIRLRSGDLVLRRQMTWVLASFALVIGVLVAGSILGSLGHTGLTDFYFPCYATVPLAVGIAILRYRLYEIDVIIRKTLVYATLVGSLTLVYLAGIYLIGGAMQTLTGQSGALAVTLSTLAVAVAFQPLRGRIQRAVDHRFYRGKYDAAKTLDAFTGRLRSQIELDALSTDVLDVVHLTVRPTHASLWLRAADPQRP